MTTKASGVNTTGFIRGKRRVEMRITKEGKITELLLIRKEADKIEELIEAEKCYTCKSDLETELYHYGIIGCCQTGTRNRIMLAGLCLKCFNKAKKGIDKLRK